MLGTYKEVRVYGVVPLVTLATDSTFLAVSGI